ncbi:hypothetical protein KM043_009484 [Ampulex compressa]|nr:hypothetical protein KM043_009484 [Ampulex compressa]
MEPAMPSAGGGEPEEGEAEEGGESRVTWLPLRGPCYLAQELAIGLPVFHRSNACQRLFLGECQTACALPRDSASSVTSRIRPFQPSSYYPLKLGV